MELMIRRSSQNSRGPFQPSYNYDPDTAHTVEVHREFDENGELGSFGFTLQYERPPLVGTIVPGGAADKAGLKKREVVIAVNGNDTTNLSHHEVVAIIYNTKSPGVWLTVCEGPEIAEHNPTSIPSGNNRFGLNLGSFSQSTPMIPKNMTDSPKYGNDDVLPKYQDIQKFSRHGSSGNVVRQRDFNNPMGVTTNMSPLTKTLLTQSVQQNGHTSSTSSIHLKPMFQSGHTKHLATFGSNSDQSLFTTSKSSPTPAATAFTSASILVLYIGPVEIPEAWSTRELSSKCLQECTRRLLSQRQEFVEAFLEVTLSSMKILSVSQTVIFKHKREELYYAGVCSNDEQYFGIVTRKIDHKGMKKSQSSSNISSKSNRAHMCHVFKVIQHKSVLILHSGDPKDSKSGKNNKQPTTQPKQKTIPVISCVTVVNAIQGLFTGAAVPGSKIFDEDTSTRSIGSSLHAFAGSGSSESILQSSGVPDKSKKKKLDVVDLRPLAYLSSPTSSILNTSPSLNQNMYVPSPRKSSLLTNHAPSSSHHVRSMSNPATDYPLSIGTPAYHQRSGIVGGGTGGGGGVVGQGQGGTSWYTSDSPKEEFYPRTLSLDSKVGRPATGGTPSSYHHDNSSGGSSGGKKTNKKGTSNIQFDIAKRFSDDSSISSMSDSRASSPNKMSHRSSFASRSRSPSPINRQSYSSHSRSPSPVQTAQLPKPGPVYRPPRMGAGAARRLASGLALEVGSIRSGAISPNSMARSFRGSRANPMKRQGSESSMMDLQDIHSSDISSQLYGNGGCGLPAKNGPLSSSIGSLATITTITENKAANDPEECGRVAGWVASFDKLLEDPLGVHTLLQFLKKEHCEENILFWKDTQGFKETASQNKNLSATVKKIYDEYLSPSSPNTVNIDDRVKKSVESRLGNPPLNIFSEACEQIYQLMKMDCYPRFKKSPLVKECLLAEMEGKPLPIDLPQDQLQQQQQQQQSQFTGIWKRHREFGFGRSLFSRFGRGRVQQEQPPQFPAGSGIWGVSPDGSGASSSSSTPESKKSRAKDGSPRLRKSNTVKEKSKRRSGGTASESRRSGGTSSNSRPLSHDSGTNQPVDDFLSEDHLDIFQAHKRDVFEVNLPNKVTKIMAVPPEGTVRDAINPVLIKHGYDLNIMELRFANNFKLIDLGSPANILIGQHIIVIRSKNTFVAVFPDVLERILPADGTKSVGDLFVGVLKEMGKLQNFSVAIEGARVSLELSTDTSVLVGQRVVVKYLPGELNWKSDELDEQSKSNTNGRTDMDDLLSMIERLSSDKLDDQRISPGAITPEPSDQSSPKGSQRSNHSPGEMKKRTQSQGKKLTNSSNRHHHHHHRQLASSKSTDSIDIPRGELVSSYHSSGRDKHRRERRPKENYLHPGMNTANNENKSFTRSLSGSSINTGNEHPTSVLQRSFSPPGNLPHEEEQNRNLSPPPPTSKPPPLPSHAKRPSGTRGVPPPPSRWSGTSFKSTDSASSEDSLTADLPHHPKQHGLYGSEQVQGNSRLGSIGSRATKGQPASIHQDAFYNKKAYQRNRPMNSRGTMVGNLPSSEYPAQVVDNGSISSSNSGNDGQRKTSWQGRPVDYSNATHPLQMSVSRGHSQSTGTSLTSYPWHSAIPQQSQQKRASMPRTQARRRVLMENPKLIQSGDQLVQQEIEEYHRRSSSDAGSSSDRECRTPLSPTTHTLSLAEETDYQTHSETFV